MTTRHKVQAVVGLTGFETQFGSFNIQRERLARLDMPEAFTLDHIKRMRRDFELLAGMTRDHPREMVALHNAVLSHDFQLANKIASDIGLNEHSISSQGGGLNWVIAGIAVAAAILLSSDSGPSSSGAGAGQSGGSDSGGSKGGGSDSGGGDGGGAPTETAE